MLGNGLVNRFLDIRVLDVLTVVQYILIIMEGGTTARIVARKWNQTNRRINDDKNT